MEINIIQSPGDAKMLWNQAWGSFPPRSRWWLAGLSLWSWEERRACRKQKGHRDAETCQLQMEKFSASFSWLQWECGAIKLNRKVKLVPMDGNEWAASFSFRQGHQSWESEASSRAEGWLSGVLLKSRWWSWGVRCMIQRPSQPRDLDA